LLNENTVTNDAESSLMSSENSRNVCSLLLSYYHD